ncbi:hypothetical protein RJ639_000102 [Escallonia herrerae]|uniref:UBN2_3 domain-containing protein n=1 Tax=Escallonia herrerae TaxID=1293975 RepID=A0AA88XBI6_9ASTE|nr:hypothetical protein RJ639_000102 [Escallonia herrerae]
MEMETATVNTKPSLENSISTHLEFYQNLHGHIDGASSPPPKTVVSPTVENLLIPNPEYEARFKKDQLLLSWLFPSLTEEIFPYIIGLSTSQEVWTALAHSFGSVSQNSQLQLYIELQELKKNNLSISEYLHNAKSLSDELSVAGKPVSPAEFNAIIYRNIGSDYHSIITAFNLCQEPVSFYELHARHAQFHEHDFPYDAAHQSSPSAAVSTPWLSLSHSVSHLDSPSISGLSLSPTSSPQSPSPILSPSPASPSHSSTSSPTNTKTPSSTFTPNLTQTLSTTSPHSPSSHSPILSHRQPQLSSSLEGLNLVDTASLVRIDLFFVLVLVGWASNGFTYELAHHSLDQLLLFGKEAPNFGSEAWPRRGLSFDHSLMWGVLLLHVEFAHPFICHH